LDFLTNWRFTSSKEGWTNDEIGLAWLQEVFLPGSKPARINEKRLLILDGHGSHITPDFMRICVTNRVHLLYLPPHTSHVLQPLDISVFGPLKAAYRTALTLANPLTNIGPTRKEDFLNCYFQARKKAITARNALSGWKGAGLWPINISKPMGSKFVVKDPNESITVQSGAPISPKTNQRSEICPFTTPSNSKDVALLVHSHKKDILASPTTRQLFRTINRGFDKLHSQMAQLEDKVLIQDKNSGQSKAKKRGRVYKDPNKEFSSIRNVKRARRRIKTPEVEDSE
jgi:4-hydroxybenzoate polyprenyltransferase